MEKRDYLDFVKEFNEANEIKKVEMVESILKKNLSVEDEMANVTIAMQEINSLNEIFDGSNIVVEYYLKKNIIFFEVLKGYTILNIKEDDVDVNNYNIIMEEILLESLMIKRFYNIVKELETRNDIQVIKDLNIALKNIPDEGSVKRMTEDFSKILNPDNKENLKLLQDIVAFNDPSMKILKESVYDSMVSDIKNVDKK